MGNGKQGIYFRGTGEQRPNFEGGQRQYWGTGNIRKQIFDFWGTGEQSNLFQGNKGAGTPLGEPLIWPSVYNESFGDKYTSRMTNVEANL